MATLRDTMETKELARIIGELRSLIDEARTARDSAEAFNLGARLAKLGEEVSNVAACWEEDALQAEENEEEWEPDYDYDDYYGVSDDFPMYLEYDDWKEDFHPGLDIDRDL